MNRLLTSLPALVVLASLVLGSNSTTAGVIAVDLSGSGGEVSGFGGAPRTGGWRFTLLGSQTVTAMGFWDEGADGLA